ncbi:MAG: RNA 2',3'-cyclic phosphodiesterase [Anaerolineales bacterium]
MMLRSFIAIKIPQEIQGAIARSIDPLQKSLPKPLVRWVAPENVHLTLKFLGDISSANLKQLAEGLKVETRNHDIFTIPVGGLGAFPNARRARVLWIGLEAPAGLQALMRGVETVAAALGYNEEDRPFSPHLTVGRVSQKASTMDLHRICSALEGTNVGSLGSVRVDAVHIFKSDLLPGGSVYTNLFNLPMKSSQDQTVY